VFPYAIAEYPGNLFHGIFVTGLLPLFFQPYRLPATDKHNGCI
jgi:hypothetical protein